VTRYLHMAIGPVQTFVGQSRRTRDLWASSYLLSFLSARGMLHAVSRGATVVSPALAENALWRLLQGQSTAVPRTGSIPNQWTIEVPTGADGRELATSIGGALHGSWQQIADAVWSRFLGPIASLPAATRAIWDRQVASFWDVVWIVDDSDRSDGLAARKHWRSFEPTDEPGDKCTVIAELQELSGQVGARDRAAQTAFWDAVRVEVATLDLDLDGKERLSAIALIKRLFPHVAKSSIGHALDELRWPSTVDLAAIPWVERVVAEAPEAAITYAREIVHHRPTAGRAGGVRDQVPVDAALEPFVSVDGNWFHASYLDTADLGAQLSADQRVALRAALKQLQQSRGRDGQLVGAPSIYYALLVADGDQVGALRKALGADASTRLGAFSAQVEGIVRGRRGVTVYAGGDDVLALLPVDRALECAGALERAYRDAFDHSPHATLSAAVVFAHARSPLDQVLKLGHTLLDEVAKAGNGRSSLVVALTHRSDRSAQWVSTWRRGGTTAVEALAALVAMMGNERAVLSSSLQHAIGSMLRQLGSGGAWQPGSFVTLAPGLELEPFVHAAVVQSLSHRDEAAQAQARALSTAICDVLAPARAGHVDVSRAGVDALLIARFLAGGGEEGEHQS